MGNWFAFSISLTQHMRSCGFELARHPQLGYLTSSPVDLGTGLSLCAHLRLPSLTASAMEEAQLICDKAGFDLAPALSHVTVHPYARTHGHVAGSTASHQLSHSRVENGELKLYRFSIHLFRSCSFTFFRCTCFFHLLRCPNLRRPLCLVFFAVGRLVRVVGNHQSHPSWPIRSATASSVHQLHFQSHSNRKTGKFRRIRWRWSRRSS